MNRKISVQFPKDLADWIARSAGSIGISRGRFIRDVLEEARAAGEKRPFMRLRGILRGLPKDLSSRRGFSRS